MRDNQNPFQQRSSRANHQRPSAFAGGPPSSARSQNRESPGNLYCALCKKNGETEKVYRNHKLRDENNQVVCPVLKQFTCPHCKACGDHTSGYCPMNPARKSPASSTANGSKSRNQRHESKTRPSSTTSIGSAHFKPSLKLIFEPAILPHYSRPDFNLDPIRFASLLNMCSLLKPEVRLKYLYQHGYNVARFQKIQQILLNWRSESIYRELAHASAYDNCPSFVLY